MRTLRAGVLYFALAFAAGWVLGPVRELWVIPRLGRTAAFLLEATVMLGVIIAAARWTARRLAVPYALTTRFGMGLVALGLLLVAEVAGIRWVRRLSFSDYLASLDLVSGGAFFLLVLLFAAMPMLVERR
jgi:hypothetical protein